MKKVFLFIGILFFGTSQAITKKKRKANKESKIRIIRQGTHEGRKTYKVILPSGVVYQYMYAEEIKESIKKGTWQYNEDLIIKK